MLCFSALPLKAISYDTPIAESNKNHITPVAEWSINDNIEIIDIGKPQPINDKISKLEPLIEQQAEQNYDNDNPIQERTTIDTESIDKESINIPFIDHQFWPTTQSYLYLRDKPITEVIQDFCKMQDINVVLSDKLQKNTQKVHQSFEKAYPINIWNQLTKTYGLLWFFDGHVLYVYESGEIETKILKIHPHQIDPLLKLTTELGFYGSNIGINPMQVVLPK